MPRITRNGLTDRVHDLLTDKGPMEAKTGGRRTSVAFSDAQTRSISAATFRTAGHIPGLRKVIALPRSVTRAVSGVTAFAELVAGTAIPPPNLRVKPETVQHVSHTPTPPPVAGPINPILIDHKAVADALTFINNKLDGSSTGDLVDITNKLNSLRPPLRNQVIGKLEDQKLRKWMDEVGSPWLGQGLDGNQKLALFLMLIPALDKHNLIRLGKAATEADEGMANKEFVTAVAFSELKSESGATIEGFAYQEFLWKSSDAKYQEQLKSLQAIYSEQTIADLINDIPFNISTVDRPVTGDRLVELTLLLKTLPSARRTGLFESDELGGHGVVLKLAVGIVTSNLSKGKKQELFDLLVKSMTTRQLADLQMALSACDFIREIDLTMNASRKSDQPLIMGSSDELGKFLENYTNPKSLQRAAKDPSINSVERWAAQHIGPWVPAIKARPTPAPISPNARLLTQSVIDNGNSFQKVDFLRELMKSSSGILSREIKARNLELAQRMVADNIMIAVYNTFSNEEKVQYGAGPRLFAELAIRQDKIKAAKEYYSVERSTEANSTNTVLSVVSQTSNHTDTCFQRFSLPRPLLRGVLAAELQFDYDTDVAHNLRVSYDIGLRKLFQIHDHHEAARYLDGKHVRKDLEAAHLDGLLDYLNSEAIQDYLKAPGYDEKIYAAFDETGGPMSENFAALMLFQATHQMWTAGKNIPESNTPSNFGDFLKHMSASDMASVFAHYRSGIDFTSDDVSYDAKNKVFQIKGGDKFAEAVGDPRAKVGYNAYQSYPYFEYFMALEQNRLSP